MNQQKDIIRDARVLGTPKMLLLGLQHMFAMFGATILVPILVNSYFQSTSQVLSVQVTLFCAGSVSYTHLDVYKRQGKCKKQKQL